MTKTEYQTTEDSSMSNDPLDNDGRMRASALSFLAGAALGGVTALLMAPTSGRELRARIGDEAESRKDAARDRVKDLSERAGRTVHDLSERATETYEQSRAATAARRDAVGEAFRAGLEAYEKALRAG